ncbi:ABC transporter permease [Pseudonocardia sp. HH130630-07]|uniref:ABC transporter permease n=1 Tax=Pseudonocardia sp. HH130630-07 TaxID=1690815 RepID=UPI000815278F|nr:ABC transporter permease [Pseudonocardia sp. HH130630-07]ANY07632.1 ABC transporter permease [Pseudonocardia sp. HH130630-07]
MDWVFRNLDLVLELTGQHAVFSLVPVLLGLVLAIPLGWLANRRSWGRTLTLNAAGFLYTLPSLALFVFLPPILGTRILDTTNVIVALTVYVLALLVRTVADALSAVPPKIVDSATAMGYRPVRRFVSVELPMAVPVIVAGLRVASVSTISLVTVGSVIGFGGLGKMFTEGFQREIPQQTIAGIVLVLLLAVVIDALLVLLGRLPTPWERAGQRARAGATT